MSETHAPFWIYGSGTVKVDLAPSVLTPRITVDGRPGVKLRNAGWHLVIVTVPSLITVADQKRKVGVRLLKVATSP
jgi:hypothetical protein